MAVFCLDKKRRFARKLGSAREKDRLLRDIRQPDLQQTLSFAVEVIASARESTEVLRERLDILEVDNRMPIGIVKSGSHGCKTFVGVAGALPKEQQIPIVQLYLLVRRSGGKADPRHSI